MAGIRFEHRPSRRHETVKSQVFLDREGKELYRHLGFLLALFAWTAPLLGVAWMQAAQGLVLPALLLALFGVGHCAGVLLAAGSLDRVQRWLDGFGGFARGRSICGGLLLLGAGALVAGA